MKVGLVGYGKMGKIREKAISNYKNAEIIAIFDIENKDNNNQSSRYFWCKNFDELLKQKIDVVFIATYVKYSAEYSIKALKAGKHVFCEKPPSMDLKEMKLVLNQEKKSGKILKYGFNHRYHYSIIEAKKIIKKGDLGKILWMRGVYGKAGSIDFSKNWRNYKKFSGGGILIDQGIHMLDLVRYLAGKDFECVHSLLTQSYWGIESEDNAFLLLKSKDGAIASLHSSATQWKHKFLIEICLENGYINLDGILSSTRSYAPETLIVGNREFEDITFAMGKPSEKITYFENDNSFQLEVNEFFNSIQKNSKIKNGSSKDALYIMKMVDKIYNK